MQKFVQIYLLLFLLLLLLFFIIIIIIIIIIIAFIIIKWIVGMKCFVTVRFDITGFFILKSIFYLSVTYYVINNTVTFRNHCNINWQL